MASTIPPAPLPPPTPRRSLWRSFCTALTRTRQFAVNGLFLLLLLLLMVTLIGSCEQTRLPAKGALLLDPRGAVVEQPSFRDPLRGLLNPQLAVRETAVSDLLRAIEHAKDDERINMLVLRLDGLQWLSISHAQTLGAAVKRFQDSGKPVVAYGYYFDQVPYLLASYASAVYMHPMGQSILPGYSSVSLYFKELLDKLKIKLHIFRVGAYKSFVEPFERDSMSEAAKQANQETLDDLWQVFFNQVVSNRQLEPAALRRYVHEFPAAVDATNGDLARAALEANLVDELLSEDESRARIAQTAGKSEDGDYIATDFRTYLQAIGPEQPAKSPHIRVLTLEGNIVMTAPSGGAIAADTVSELLRQMNGDNEAAALVVRVDSPGGSSFASELIRKELELIQLAGKPVVISMANTAASGGYWISATADAIVAEPTTITGSIGIFSLIPTFERSLDALGVHADGVGTTPMSRALHPLTGINQAMSQVLQNAIEHGYEQFTNLVARGRGLPLQQVEALAQGRIWTGTRAQQLGLVDELGGLEQAIAKAAELAELKDYGVRHLRAPRSARELLLQELLGSSVFEPRQAATTSPLWGAARHWQTQAQQLLTLTDPNNRFALCELCLGFAPAR